MADVYTKITEADTTVVERLAELLELRAADPQQQAMLAEYLAGIAFTPNAHVLEIGCGTGAIARQVAAHPNVACAVGVDPSPLLVEHARRHSTAFPNLDFRQGDGCDLPFAGESFDVAILHTVLSHLEQPQAALREAHRVLQPGGWLAIFDGDYASVTCATGVLDPLQLCVDAMRSSYINDIWLGRRLPLLAAATGFVDCRYRTYNYIQTAAPDYFLTIVDRGADTLAASGTIGEQLAAALKAEARRRVDCGQFFGSIAYASLLARKPA
jgi:ubiquinone/menaquinone biosynthesis C-methylase UbiE